jgi:hypothetical protein
MANPFERKSSWEELAQEKEDTLRDGRILLKRRQKSKGCDLNEIIKFLKRGWKE